MINFDAPTSLLKGKIQVHMGLLSECIYLQQQKSDKTLYSIETSDNAKIGKTVLDHQDIEKLVKEPNYPMAGL